VEHEKNTFFSLLKNTRSGGISQGRVSAAASGRSEAKRLYGCRSEGYGASARKRPVKPQLFIFNRLPRSNFLLPQESMI